MFGWIQDRLVAAGVEAEQLAEELGPVRLHLEGLDPGLAMEDDGSDYLALFTADHGEPVSHPRITGATLFPDGWGLEMQQGNWIAYPPPSDPMAKRELQVAYWEKRRAVLLREADFCRQTLADERAEALPSVFAPYRRALEEFEAEVAECSRKLEGLHSETVPDLPS